MARKTKTMKNLFHRYILMTIAAAILAVISMPLFTILYFQTENIVFFILLLVTLGVLLAGYSLELIFYTLRLYKLFYSDIYQTTDRNLTKLKLHQKGLDLYQASEVGEVRKLNDNVLDLNYELEHMVQVALDKDYSKINLNYIDKKKRLVDHHTFHDHIAEIVFCSQSYRNVLIQAYYDFEGKGNLTPEEEEQLIGQLARTFATYDNILFSVTQSRDGVYLYLPSIDSISDIREKVNSLLNQASLMRQNEQGSLVTLSLHFAIVCYPYSLINDLFADIHYAKRMGNIINEYFPSRLINMSDNKLVMNESMNLNNMSKILSTVTNLNIYAKNPWDDLKQILSNYGNLMNLDQVGLIVLEDSTKTFRTLINTGKKSSSGFVEGQEVYMPMVTILGEIKDDDRSYYFSRRQHLSQRLGEAFDRLSIQSGYFYTIYGDRNNLRAILYFVNQDHDLILDTYMKESMLMVATKISDFYMSVRRVARFTDEAKVTSAVLKLSDFAMYKINPKTYQLTDISDGIIDALHGNVKRGDYCYKALYGLEHPCDKCPLRTSKKMRSRLEPWEIETSTTINMNERENDDVIMLAKRLPDENLPMENPYDPNLLVNSYYTLIQTMKNAYYLNNRGYLLLLKFDNLMEIVSKYGSEPATQGLRVFADKLRGLETISNVYYYKPDTLAIVLSDYGQIDVVNECEAIYELNRTSCFKDNETLFSITYLPIMYPQGYASAADFLRHAENFYSSGKYKSGKNFIYFDESDYSRPASKNEFMLSVIDDKFTNKDFTVNLQPLVHTSNRKIFGAELLLRLSDEYRKIVFNADQLIKVAAANGKIGLISSALLEYVGELYDQYGLSIFKVYGFERLTINTDYSYLSDSNLTEKITELFTKHHVPKGFLGFEITEKDIYDHYDDMKKFMNTLSALGVIMICDRYSGEFLSFDRLKELNVTEFKIDRFYTRFIDTDRQKYTMVRSLLEAAKGSDITAGLIGVENMEQYKMIHEINNDSYLQGYAFFKPMDKGSLVDVVRKTNTALKGAK